MTYVIYQTQDAQGHDLGAAVESTTGGFGGDLKVLVGFDAEGNILGYEVLKLLAHKEGKWVDILRWPGMQMQYLTTNEPDDEQLECAIAAMERVLEREERAEREARAAAAA